AALGLPFLIAVGPAEIHKVVNGFWDRRFGFRDLLEADLAQNESRVDRLVRRCHASSVPNILFSLIPARRIAWRRRHLPGQLPGDASVALLTRKAIDTADAIRTAWRSSTTAAVPMTPHRHTRIYWTNVCVNRP